MIPCLRKVNEEARMVKDPIELRICFALYYYIAYERWIINRSMPRSLMLVAFSGDVVSCPCASAMLLAVVKEK